MEAIDDARRAAIARDWMCSSLNQREFAAENGISERTLRAWVSRFAVRQPTGENVRAVVVETIGKLTAILQALDADAASRTADGSEPSTVAADHRCPAALRLPWAWAASSVASI